MSLAKVFNMKTLLPCNFLSCILNGSIDESLTFIVWIAAFACNFFCIWCTYRIFSVCLFSIKGSRSRPSSQCAGSTEMFFYVFCALLLLNAMTLEASSVSCYVFTSLLPLLIIRSCSFSVGLRTSCRCEKPFLRSCITLFFTELQGSYAATPVCEQQGCRQMWQRIISRPNEDGL